MKLQINKPELIQVLAKSQNIAEKKSTMPVLINVLMEAKNNHLHIFATDLEVSLADSVPCTVLEPGKLAVNSKSLYDLVRELENSQPINLVRGDNNWLSIQQGNFRSKIVGISPQEYPVFPEFMGEQNISIDAKDLLEMVEKTVSAVSINDTRYYLNGVYFESLGNEGCQMVGTDGHRLSLIKKNIMTQSLFVLDQGVIIPRKGLLEVMKLLETASGNIEVAIDGAQIRFRHQNTTYLIRLIEGKYLNYRHFIPQNLQNKFYLNRMTFLNSVKRVSLLANQKSRAITFALGNGNLLVSSESPEFGDAKEELPVDYSGAEMKISFNSRYISEILNNIESEEVCLELGNQNHPGVLRPKGASNYFFVVMPMRI